MLKVCLAQTFHHISVQIQNAESLAKAANRVEGNGSETVVVEAPEEIKALFNLGK